MRGRETHDGESTACLKGPPKRFFFRSLRERKIPIGWEAPEGINGCVDWPRKLSSRKSVNQRKYEIVSKHVNSGKMFCWQELEKKLNFSVIGDPGTGEIIVVFQCTLRKEEYRKNVILLFLKRSESSKLLCAFTYAGGSKIELSKNVISINNYTIETIKLSLWS